MNQQRILEHCPICDGNNLVVYKRRSRLAGQLITVECRSCLCSAPIDHWNNGRPAAPLQHTLLPHPGQLRLAH